MKIANGADHAGVELKDHLREALRRDGHEVVDVGTDNRESTDYPDYARAVAESVAGGAAERGILVCSTGVGMSIAANKVEGIRAALAVQPEQVRLSRAHNNANVLTLGGNFTAAPAAEEMVGVFLNTAFDGGRHARRVEKIHQMEKSGGQ
ncbi:MAG: ribose 5-phosphate isomerase B [Bryobacteraceae bacterium]